MFKNLLGFIALVIFTIVICMTARAYAEPAPKTENIVLAGGCFWGMQAVFQHTKGVTIATSGYAGGNANTAQYEIVSNGTTGHAESVQVTYDPAQITLEQLLSVYFTVAHNPTELNRQGPDSGTQYRSAVFTTTPEQLKGVEAYITLLQKSGTYSSPIVTTVEPLKGFYAAEDYHQNYARLHPYNPYILINDAPKVTALKKKLPDLYVEPQG
jgi:peptide-methionine (S)-S-oxide reductase